MIHGMGRTTALGIDWVNKLPRQGVFPGIDSYWVGSHIMT